MNTNTDTKPPSPRPSLAARLWGSYLRPLLVVGLVVFGFRSTVMDWNVVPTGSMKPTIVEGDYILVDKLAYAVRVPFLGWTVAYREEPKRGDIVVFDPPGEHDRFVKRIVGLPGDVLEMRDNRLYLNGRPVAYYDPDGHGLDDMEPLSWPGVEVLAGRAHEVLMAQEPTDAASFGPVTVPAGHFFMLGDNRDNSKDSRWFGPVARERIVGRVSRVLASFDPKGTCRLRTDGVSPRLACAPPSLVFPRPPGSEKQKAGSRTHLSAPYLKGMTIFDHPRAQQNVMPYLYQFRTWPTSSCSASSEHIEQEPA